MRTHRFVGAAALAAGALVLATAGGAAADTNINTHSPSMLCDTGPLAVNPPASTCEARQNVKQGVLKTHTEDVDLINRLDIAIPATLGL
ncbi:hypothetical protein GL263_16515 [Streptomyces durbertensis]|uniref:Secreted protein n=1 Tax=Streptomyces durbertensis TaxID=2448886 RepID=A0ABR6EJA6_9ACTN|nr:hypothetical protein [Streptomyces durbertensis]MBB1245162.1 hypothetical protein [Streptomyces durbertensis]